MGARRRIYLQSFQFLLRRIKGKDNIVADWASRMQEDESTEESVQSLQKERAEEIIGANLCLLCHLGEGEGRNEDIKSSNNEVSENQTARDYLHQVHRGQMTHFG